VGVTGTYLTQKTIADFGEKEGTLGKMKETASTGMLRFPPGK
jgi:hypothetical protein